MKNVTSILISLKDRNFKYSVYEDEDDFDRIDLYLPCATLSIFTGLFFYNNFTVTVKAENNIDIPQLAMTLNREIMEMKFIPTDGGLDICAHIPDVLLMWSNQGNIHALTAIRLLFHDLIERFQLAYLCASEKIRSYR